MLYAKLLLMERKTWNMEHGTWNMEHGTCSRQCMKQLNINNGKISGPKGSISSFSTKTFKNEVAYSELCIEYFGKDDMIYNVMNK